MNSDGSDETRINKNPEFDEFHPSWSPDSSKIAFVSSREGLDEEIYVMHADGSNPTRLTDRLGLDQGPAWSPDGSKIAFHSLISITENARDDNFDIFVMDADGSDPINVTNHSRQDTNPLWSLGTLP